MYKGYKSNRKTIDKVCSPCSGYNICVCIFNTTTWSLILNGVVSNCKINIYHIMSLNAAELMVKFTLCQPTLVCSFTACMHSDALYESGYLKYAEHLLICYL